nr:zinc finger, CCHC-type [Tanacetum cinerariifolium]
MHFLLMTLKVVYLLTTPMPELVEDATVEAIRIRVKWENDDYICRGHILNGMSDSLFDVYINVESAKELWDSHESKILRQYTQHGLKMDESISVSSIIDKLPPSWKDFKHTLKHGKDDLSLVHLGSHLRIEESLRAQKSDKSEGKEVGGPSVNMTGEVDAIAWWIDFGATTHVCKDRCWFKTYEPVEDEYVLYMGHVHYKRMFEMSKDNLIPAIDENLEKYTTYPRTYNEAMQSQDAAFWKEAVDDEIGSIMENNTWVLSDLPHGWKPLGCKLIFKRKMKVDETIDKFKARLVIQGFRQKEGIDYFDTYAPIARITTIRLLLALAAIHNLVIHQMDVKTSFLNGDLDEEVYMKQPERFVMADDMLIFRTDQNQVDKTKKFLSSIFSIKDMEEADVILGIKIKCENKGIVITRSYYIEKTLKKFNREDCSSVSTPMDPIEKLKPNTGKPVDQLEYSRAIGCLMYVMTSTRPDIAYDVGRLSYSDASWINHVEDSSSTSGWVFLLEGGAISWASKKQTCITGLTMKSEFVALSAAGKEVEWLRNLIHEILVWPKPIAPISI